MLVWTAVLLAVGALLLGINVFSLVGLEADGDKWFDALFFVVALAMGYRLYAGKTKKRDEELDPELKELSA